MNKINELLSIVCLLVLACFIHCSFAEDLSPSGKLVDSRDGQSYKTVRIGKLNWMAENLNYESENSYCFDDKAINCAKYGRLYSGKTAMDVCPAGWRLPTEAEWAEIISIAGGSKHAGKSLKSKKGWLNGGNGSDDVGFSALPAGIRYENGLYANRESYAGFWSSSEDKGRGGSSSYESFSMNLRYFDDLAKLDGEYMVRWQSVRCVQHTPVFFDSSLKKSAALVIKNSVTDSRDGRTYKTVKIGNQTWMAENMNFETEGSYCGEDGADSCAKYGRFYTWKAAMYACPAGWRLPEQAEWSILISVAGGVDSAGMALKSSSGWKKQGDGRDVFGFTALPAGELKIDYKNKLRFEDQGESASFWSSTELGLVNAYRGMYLSRYHGSAFSHFSEEKDNYGYSVRCIKDDDVARTAQSKKELPSDENNLVDSRDGQIYKTVDIGDKIWMAENLNYDTEYSVCYKNYESLCMKYGRLYRWNEAKEACPVGWRLPTETDWVDLLRMAGANVSAEQTLNSIKGWDRGANGLDVFGFSAFPTGYYVRDEDRYRENGSSAYFWSATEINKDSSFAVNLHSKFYEYDMLHEFKNYENNLIHKLKKFSFNVRCVKDKLPSDKQQPQKAQTMKDSRDGRTYKTVKIGKQTWMAENLNYKTQSSFCYGDSSSCEKYGQLYDWRSLVNICPAGWRLPRKADWETLINAVGGEAVAGKMLKASSDWHYCERQKGRFENGFGRDDFGFSALPAGYRMNYLDYDEKIGFTTCFHSIEMDGSSDTAVCVPSCNDSIILQNNFSFNAYSVRCIKDDFEQKNIKSSFVPPSNVVKGTFKDPRDKKTYKTVKIGSQTWMAENIMYKTKNSICKDESADSQVCAESERLYTWSAAMKVCPRGWHLPTDADWNTLVSAVGGRLIASKVLKTAYITGETHGETIGWCDFCNDVVGDGTDDYGFAAIPIGSWDVDEGFYMDGFCAEFWSSTNVKADSASVMSICCSEHTNIVDVNKRNMYTVRCVKDK